MARWDAGTLRRWDAGMLGGERESTDRFSRTGANKERLAGGRHCNWV